MPLVCTHHGKQPELELELQEIWRAIDGIRQLLDWLFARVGRIENELGIEPEPPPDDGVSPWPGPGPQ